MSLWFLCCLLLFVGARGYDWVSHQSWFLVPELSLPWLILGGIGLAIASNRRALISTFEPRAHQPLKPTSPVSVPPVESGSTSSAVAVVLPRAATKPASISFEIATDKSPATAPNPEAKAS